MASATAADAGAIRESATEFFGTADFDQDGRRDLVIVDKDTGKYRLGTLKQADCSIGLIAAPVASRVFPGSV